MASTVPSLVVIEPRTVGIGSGLGQLLRGLHPVPGPVQALHLHQPPGEQRQDERRSPRRWRSADGADCGGAGAPAPVAPRCPAPGRPRPAAARRRRDPSPSAARLPSRPRSLTAAPSPSRCGRCSRRPAAGRRAGLPRGRGHADAAHSRHRPGAARARHPRPAGAPRSGPRSGPRLPPGTPAGRRTRRRTSRPARPVAAVAVPAPVPAPVAAPAAAPAAGHGVNPGTFGTPGSTPGCCETCPVRALTKFSRRSGRMPELVGALLDGGRRLLLGDLLLQRLLLLGQLGVALLQVLIW